MPCPLQFCLCMPVRTRDRWSADSIFCRSEVYGQLVFVVLSASLAHSIGMPCLSTYSSAYLFHYLIRVGLLQDCHPAPKLTLDFAS